MMDTLAYAKFQGEGDEVAFKYPKKKNSKSKNSHLHTDVGLDSSATFLGGPPRLGAQTEYNKIPIFQNYRKKKKFDIFFEGKKPAKKRRGEGGEMNEWNEKMPCFLWFLLG